MILIQMQSLLVAVLISLLFAIAAFYMKWLDLCGSFAACLLSMVILIAGSWQLVLPMMLFFVSGSLFSKLKSHAVISDEKSKKPRDHIQVLSNGGIAGFCLLLYLLTNQQVFIEAYFMSIAISTADTWSSELGLHFGGNTVDILTLKKLEKGLSGGVSLIGTLAGLTGAFLIGLLYLVFTHKWQSPLLITAVGFAGTLLDSVIGSSAQAVYRLTNGMRTEVRMAGETILEKGFPWMTNDLVNFLSNVVLTLLGTLVAVVAL